MMTSTILDLGPERTEKGVTARHLWIAGHDGRRVPALVLTPEGAQGPRPAVLLETSMAVVRSRPARRFISGNVKSYVSGGRGLKFPSSGFHR